MLDGYLLVLSPWTVRNVRFDESLCLGATARPYDFAAEPDLLRAGQGAGYADLRIDAPPRLLELFSGRSGSCGLRSTSRWPTAGSNEGAQEDWPARVRAARRPSARPPAPSPTATRLVGLDARLLIGSSASSSTPPWAAAPLES